MINEKKTLPTRFVSEEEREAKYNRVLSSSILALGHLIHVTSSDKGDAEMEELYLNVLRQNKFWKYARHKSPNVGVQLIYHCSKIILSFHYQVMY